MTKNSREPTQIPLSEGRSLEIVHADQTLRIADRDGVTEVEIELRATGPVVRVRAAALQVETRGELALTCERFEVHARDGIRLVSAGDLAAAVAGDLDLRAAGHAHCEGKSVRVRARRGEALLDAHDDVRIEGERVLLNS